MPYRNGGNRGSQERRQFSSSPEQLRSLASWLIEREVQEAVMESTAHSGKPVWKVLERSWKPACQQRDAPLLGALHWAQAKSNRAPGGCKNAGAMPSGWSGPLGGAGIGAEFRTGGRTAPLADRDTPETAVDAGAAEPTGRLPGRGLSAGGVC